MLVPTGLATSRRVPHTPVPGDCDTAVMLGGPKPFLPSDKLPAEDGQ